MGAQGGVPRSECYIFESTIASGLFMLRTRLYMDGYRHGSCSVCAYTSRLLPMNDDSGVQRDMQLICIRNSLHSILATNYPLKIARMIYWKTR